MKEIVERGTTSVIRHAFIQDSSSTTGAGLTALAHDAANLAGAKIRNDETLVTLTFETISTLGTYAAPTSNAHIRIKLLHDTNAPGMYELQFHNDWFNTTNDRRSLSAILFGATNMAPLPIEFQLCDPIRGVGSPTALPGAAAEAAGGLYTQGSGAGQINQAANGQVDTNVVYWLGQACAAVTVNGVPKIDMSYILGHLLTQTGTQVADGFQHFFDIAAPAITVADAMVGTDGANTTAPDNANIVNIHNIVNHADHGNAQLVRSTTPANKLDVSNTGEAGLDFANIKDATGAHTLTNITVPTTTDVTNRVTADMTYIHGSALTETAGQLAGRFKDFFDQASTTFNVATVLSSFKATCLNAAGVRGAVGLASASLDTQLGTLSTHNAAAVVTALGTGTTLTAIPWNGSWDAEVQSKVQDALEANNLDHLCKAAVANNADMTAEVVDGTVLSNMLSKTSDTSTYVVADDSLQGISEGAAGDGLNAQETRDAMKLAPTAGAPAAGSVDKHLDDASTHNAAAVATLILATPAQKLVTNASGYVTYANAAPPSADTIASTILVTPANQLATSTSGYALAKRDDGTTISGFNSTSDNVTVDNITAAALALFALTDTGQVSAQDGSVAKLAQGAAGGGATAQQVWEYATRELTAFAFAVETDSASREASKASVPTVEQIDTELSDMHGAGLWLTGATGGDATEAKQDEIIVDLADIKGTAFAKDTHSLPQCLTTTIADATVTFTPVAVTVSAGAITDNAIAQYQNAAFGPFVFTIIDSDDAAVDLSGSALTFAVYDADDPSTVLWSLTSGAGDVSVGGAENNQVTVSNSDTNTGTAGIYRYALWDTTNDYVRARGTLTIARESDSS